MITCPHCGGEISTSAPATPDHVLRLIEEVARGSQCLPDEITGRDQTAHITDARRTVAKLLRAQGYPLKTIGRWLNRDHTSIRYLVRT